jgi:hypothetical protein
MRRTAILFVAAGLLLGLAACAGPAGVPTPVTNPAGPAVSPTAPLASPTAPAEIPPPPPAGALIQPGDLVYRGAFRLPDVDAADELTWRWSGAALTYYPDGDPTGPGDGAPGSLFGTGHDWNQWVSEVSIPAPAISAAKDPAELNTAVTLQPFHDIRAGLFGPMEIPRAGLEYLPAQGEQASGKLYFAWAQHMGEGETSPSHGWCDLYLANPHTAGLWRIDNLTNFVTGDYLLAIPEAWAAAHTPGLRLATGRYRDGGQGAQGPSLFAIGPWNEGNPPPPGSALPAVPLLLYGNVYTEGSPAMNGYHHSDEWSGAAWLTAGDRSAVIFAGTKGTGDCWYGCSDGTVWPDEPPYPESCPDYDRGWWSTGFEGQILFYDPAGLAAVARGDKEAWQPQPYAVLKVDPVLYHVTSPQIKSHLGAVAYDRARGLLYVMEPLADEDKPLVHVWQVR